MRDDYQLEEMSGAVGLGLMASDVVLATTKALRTATLTETDRQTLRYGERLLGALSEPLTDLPLRADVLGHLSSKSSTLDAIHAMQLKFPGEDFGEQIRPLAEALRQLLEASVSPDQVTALTSVRDRHADTLGQVRDLFASIADVEVTRVATLSHPTHDAPPWLTSKMSSSS